MNTKEWKKAHPDKVKKHNKKFAQKRRDGFDGYSDEYVPIGKIDRYIRTKAELQLKLNGPEFTSQLKTAFKVSAILKKNQPKESTFIFTFNGAIKKPDKEKPIPIELPEEDI